MKAQKKVKDLGVTLSCIVGVGYVVYGLLNPGSFGLFASVVSFDPRLVLSLIMIVLGLFSFFSVLSWGVGENDRILSKTDVRVAIVVSVVVSYLFLVANVTFWTMTEANTELAALTSLMVSHFTSIVGVVIAFYFGATAFEAVFGKGDPADSALIMNDDATSGSSDNEK